MILLAIMRKSKRAKIFRSFFKKTLDNHAPMWYIIITKGNERSPKKKGSFKMNKEFYEIHSAEYEEAQEVFREMAESLYAEYDEDDVLNDYEYGDDDVGFNPYMGCYDFDC